MAEYGEWIRKGAVLSDLSARKQYGVDRDFIIAGIEAGKIEYRRGSVEGVSYLRILRSQLEAYIAAEHGKAALMRSKQRNELRAVDKEIAELRKRLAELEGRRAELKASVAS